jgi:hypothetical protein
LPSADGININGNGALTGTVSWWKAKGNANDSVGTNNGTLQGGATFAPGISGQAFSFDGSNSYVFVPDSATLSPSASITVDVCIAASPTGNYEIFVSKFNHNSGPPGSPPDDSYALLARPDGAPRWQLETVGGGSVTDNILDATSVNILDGRFHHLAGTYDGNMMRLYVDGVLVFSQAATGSIQACTTPLLLGAGYNNGTVDYYTKGLLDEAAIYNRALSASEIQNLYKLGAPAKAAPRSRAT